LHFILIKKLLFEIIIPQIYFSYITREKVIHKTIFLYNLMLALYDNLKRYIMEL